MKVYISARAKTRLRAVQEMQSRLQSMGYEVAYDWTATNVKRPYRSVGNRKHNIAIQKEMLEQAAKTDIFILLDESSLRGAYVELGAFLHECLKNSKNRTAYIVGPHSHEREFIFESPEYVKFTDTIEEVYKDLGV